MLGRVALRLAILVASLAVASLLIFWITQALPGDIARVMLGDGASPEQLAAKRTELGTDRPFRVQYTDWVLGMLTPRTAILRSASNCWACSASCSSLPVAMITACAFFFRPTSAGSAST